MSYQLNYLPALEANQESYPLPVTLHRRASKLTAAALVLLAVTMSVPGLHALTNNPLVLDSYLQQLLMISYILPGGFILLLAGRALCSTEIVISTDMLKFSRVLPLFGQRCWTEPLSNYQGLMIELSSGSTIRYSSLSYAAVLIHRSNRRRNITLLVSTEKGPFYRSANALSKQLNVVMLADSTHMPAQNSTEKDSFEGTEYAPASEFEHIFVEQQNTGGGIVVKCFHRQSAFWGALLMLFGSFMLTCAHAFHSPSWSLVSIPLTLFGLMVVCRGLFVYDYLNISQDKISRGVSLFGYTRQHGHISSGEIENVTIAIPDNSRRDAVQVVGETRIICFGESASAEEREWIRSIIAELVGQADEASGGATDEYHSPLQ